VQSGDVAGTLLDFHRLKPHLGLLTHTMRRAVQCRAEAVVQHRLHMRCYPKSHRICRPARNPLTGECRVASHP
jgi:hypothetical protein